MKRWMILASFLLVALPGWAAQQYSATGVVLKVDKAHKNFIVSCQDIPGFMNAMTMPFDVHETKELDGLTAGMTVEFTLVVDRESSYAQHVHILSYESVEQDPLTARRLKFLNQISHPESASSKALSAGQAVPDFTLTDQDNHSVSFSQFTGKVVAINFIYTSCALPNFCFRSSNNFGVLQRRFKEQMGRELVLLTVTFDPLRDQPDVLARYANTWKAIPGTWYFLTGPVPDIQRVSNMFGVDYFPDEGLMNHSLHTAIIDRRGKLVANLEGNKFTADQLADLVQIVLTPKSGGQRSNQVHLAHNEGSEPVSSK